jgi:hypothetical protein
MHEHWGLSAAVHMVARNVPTVVVHQSDLIIAHEPVPYQCVILGGSAESMGEEAGIDSGWLDIHPARLLAFCLRVLVSITYFMT